MTDFPSEEALLEYISEAARLGEGTVTRREVAEAFSIKGPQRTALRAALKELSSKGRITLEGPRVRPRGGLPPVAVVDITGTDQEGDLLCSAVTGDAPDDIILTLDARTAGKSKPAIGVGDRVLGRLTAVDGEPGHYIVAPIKRIGKGQQARTLGVYRQHARGGMVEPVSRKGTALDIPKGESHGARDGDLVWAERLSARGYGPKRGRIAEVIGDGGERKNWSLIALAENDIPIDFPSDVVAEAEAQEMPAAKYYEDLKDTPLITIDPREAKDHDDAVYAEQTPDGWRLIIAIADVSAFVRSGSPLDKEAEKRGNSVYLIDRVVPMLPEALSNDLCSLKANQVRPALACEIHLDHAGKKRTHRFFRTMIKCVAGLAYEEAQAAADGRTTRRTEALKGQVIDPLWGAWRALCEARKSRPSLDLDMPERQIILGPEGAVERVKVKERLDAHRLIESFMVLANVCAAETLERKKQSLIYRVHGEPDPERVDTLRIFLQSMDYSLPKGQVLTPQSFNRILEKARAKDELHLVAMAVLRTQMQAVYDVSNIGHFGLNLARYAHFTSPIRRYADLVVHRALVKSLDLGPGPMRAEDEDRLEGVAEHISMTERRAISAERSTQDRYLAAFLEGKTGAAFPARINGVTSAGIFVTLDETGADGFVPLRSLRDDYYVHDEELQALIGRHTGGRFRLGQRVEVRLLEATPVQGGLRFEMLTEASVPEGDNRPAGTPLGKRGNSNTRRGRRGKEARGGAPSGKLPPRVKKGAATSSSGPNADEEVTSPEAKEDLTGLTVRRRPKKKKPGARRKAVKKAARKT